MAKQCGLSNQKTFIMEYIYVYREDDAAEIKEYRVGFIKKTAEELVELYNREARMGITGVHRQALYLLALKIEFDERFGLSPISFEDSVLGIGKEIEGWVAEVPDDQEDPIEFKINGITYKDSEKLKLVFSGLIIRVDSINRYFGKLRTFLDSHVNYGVTNGKLLLMLEMNSPPHYLIEFSENVLIPLGLKEKEDFIFAEEEMVSSEKIERHSTTNQPNSGCINISWIG